MAWQTLGGVLARHRELALALSFIGMAAWELAEFLILERPLGPGRSLAIALHSVQVGLVVGATWVVIRAWQERTRQDETIARMVEKVVMAQEEERRRIAYDVHDGVAQLIVSAKQHVDTARELGDRDGERTGCELGRAAQRLQSAIVETRRVLQALRPSAVDSVGLSEAMRQALEDAAREAGWSARFVDNLGDARLPAAVETAAFRILQESLVNASRHSHSTSVEVELSRRQRWLHLDVRDDGVGLGDGAPPAGRGMGLAGMRERARLLGGTCRIESGRAGGTSISVALPLGPAGADAF
ncbi:MAG TPA: sensor histidine kinase [Candidatus Methylomirabilis sp.]|nr:sensor histidine kinase [Candidatus Methylomirabilis sp.]